MTLKKVQYSQSIILMHPEADLKRTYKSTCHYNLMNGQYREEMLLWPQMEKIVEMNSVCHGLCDECRHFKKVVEYGSVFRPVEYQSKVVLNDRVPEHRFESSLMQDKGYRHYKSGLQVDEDAGSNCGDEVVENGINGEVQNSVGDDDDGSFYILRQHHEEEFDDRVSFISNLTMDLDADDDSIVENGEDINGLELDIKM